MGRAIASLPSDTLDLLSRYRWPGNVRELENVIERAMVLASDVITPDDLPAPIWEAMAPASEHEATPVNTTSALQDRGVAKTASEIERVHIMETLARCDWNMSHAAKILGIGRTTLWRKLKRYERES